MSAKVIERGRVTPTIVEGTTFQLVMPGLVPGIHVLAEHARLKDVDGRDEPGHDDVW